MFLANCIDDPVLKAVHKCQRHLGVRAIKQKYKELNFSFSNVGL